MKTMVFILCITSTALWAQPINKPVPNPTPIDGGLVLLASAGAAYGIKKYRQNNKKDLA